MTDISTTEAVETKEQAFSRLATARVRKALKMISLLSNLASPQYKASEEQLQKIEDALTTQVQTTMRKLRKEKTVTTSFEL